MKPLRLHVLFPAKLSCRRSLAFLRSNSSFYFESIGYFVTLCWRCTSVLPLFLGYWCSHTGKFTTTTGNKSIIPDRSIRFFLFIYFFFQFSCEFHFLWNYLFFFLLLILSIERWLRAGSQLYGRKSLRKKVHWRLSCPQCLHLFPAKFVWSPSPIFHSLLLRLLLLPHTIPKKRPVPCSFLFRSFIKVLDDELFWSRKET